jgi:hypothetical protein
MRSCMRRGTITVASLGLTINIEMHINIESDCRDALPAGALPPTPHAFGGTGFFYAGDGCRSHFKPPREWLRFRLDATRHRRGQTLEPLLEQGSSPVKRSSSRARVPQGLLKPSSRRVKESFTGSLRLVQLKDIQNVSIWSTI